MLTSQGYILSSSAVCFVCFDYDIVKPDSMLYGTSWLVDKDALSSVIPANLRRDWLVIFGHSAYIYSIFANVTTDCVHIRLLGILFNILC